jgi:hypothetical protein
MVVGSYSAKLSIAVGAGVGAGVPSRKMQYFPFSFLFLCTT